MESHGECEMITGVTLGVAILALIVALWRRPIETPTQPGANWFEPKQTAAQTLAELKAQEELEKKYKWVIPRYNKYLGKNIADKDVTNEMLSDNLFVNRHGQGRWVKK